MPLILTNLVFFYKILKLKQKTMNLSGILNKFVIRIMKINIKYLKSVFINATNYQQQQPSIIARNVVLRGNFCVFFLRITF